MHPVRISFSFFYIIGTIKVIIGIDDFIIVPFPIINSCCFLGCFQFFLIFELGFWRIGNTKNLMVDIQTRINHGNYHSFTFITLVPGLWNSNNLVAFNTLRFFSSITALTCFRACRSSHCCSFFYRFNCLFRICLWSSCSLFRSLYFFKNSSLFANSFFFRNSSFFRNLYFFTSDCIRSFCNL